MDGILWSLVYETTTWAWECVFHSVYIMLGWCEFQYSWMLPFTSIFIFMVIYSYQFGKPLKKNRGNIQHNQSKIYDHIAPRPWMGDVTQRLTKEAKEAITFRQETFGKTMVKNRSQRLTLKGLMCLVLSF